MCGIESSVSVCPKRAALFDADERTFEDSESGQHCRGMQFLASDPLDLDLPGFLYVVRESLSGIAAIRQHTFHLTEIPSAECDSSMDSIEVVHLNEILQEMLSIRGNVSS